MTDRIGQPAQEEVRLTVGRDMLSAESVRGLTSQAAAALHQGARRLVISCEQVELVGSSFVAGLVWIAREAHRLGARCAVLGLHGNPLEVLDLCRVRPVLAAAGVSFQPAGDSPDSSPKV